MSFMAFGMLFGSLAAGVPIALHLFYRSRYRNVPWAAMQFLLTSVEQTSRRLKFQELILLLMRIILLVLLALALAQPFLKSGSAASSSLGDSVDAIFIIDNSYSMAVREQQDGSTRIDQAREAAKAVLAKLPSDSTVNVLASSDRAVVLPPEKEDFNPADFENVGKVIDSVQITHRATDFRPAFDKAQDMIRAMNESQARLGQVRKKAVYLFSDLQALGWQRQEKDLAVMMPELSKLAAIYLVRCGQHSPSNVAVVDIRPPSGILHTGERATFTVQVRNTGKTEVRGLAVRLEVNGSKDQGGAAVLAGEQGHTLAPGEIRSIPVSARFEKKGANILTAFLSGDELDVDNRLDRIVDVHDKIQVVIIDGNPEPDVRKGEPREPASYFLAHALSPVSEALRRGYHIQPRVVPVGRAQKETLEKVDVCILANVKVPDAPGGIGLPPAFTEELARRVRGGMSLIIFGGSEVDATAYNRVLADQHQILPVKLAPAFDAPSPDKPFFLDPSTALPPFERFQEKPLILIGLVEVKKALGVEEPTPPKPGDVGDGPARVVMRYSPIREEKMGRPAVVTRRAGLGTVMLITTSPDVTWTFWPILPEGIFLAFMHEAIQYLLPEQVVGLNRHVGEPLTVQGTASEVGKPATIQPPKGEAITIESVPAVQGRAAVTFADTDFAGVYRVTLGNAAEPTSFAVALEPKPDDATRLRESDDLTGMDDAAIENLTGVKMRHLDSSGNASSFAASELINGEWAVWLLVAVLVMALAEAAMAWFCGRPISA
jgi:hypothetical protein